MTCMMTTINSIKKQMPSARDCSQSVHKHSSPNQLEDSTDRVRVLSPNGGTPLRHTSVREANSNVKRLQDGLNDTSPSCHK